MTTKTNGSQLTRRVVKGEPGGRNGSAGRSQARQHDGSESDSEPDASASSRFRPADSDMPPGSDSADSDMPPGSDPADSYKPGSIKHIALSNFVTYDQISVTPGPHLNMIIGPNGTGKSTIVCAIALGLGEKTAVLGRAKDISEFVKHGHEQGHVEITLAGKQPGSEVKIRREIYRENNRTVWRIDGRPCSAGEVARTTRELHVQVGSLCQFLPQDRVVEFSKLSAQALLRETLVAVGRDDLLQLQAELVDRRQKERALLDDHTRLAGETAALQKKYEALERDVQRWRERQEAESQLRVLAALVPVARYTAAKAAYDAAKEARRRAHVRYQETRSATGPAEDEILEIEGRVAAAENSRRQLADKRAALERAARQRLARLGRLEAEQRDLRGELEDVRRRAQRRREQMAGLRAEVARLAAALDESPRPAAEPDEAARAMNETRALKLEANNEIVALQDEQQAVARAGRRLNDEVARRAEQLRGLDDVMAQRREALRRFSEDTWRALEWLEQNRGLFAQHVFAPICLEASVRDARYAALVETVVGASTLRTFVAQCDADYHVFARNVIDGMRLRVDVVSLRRTLDDFRAPVAAEGLRALGFDGYAVDFVDAPRAVLAALCDRDRIHAVPVALGPVDNEAARAQNAFKEYVAGGTHYAVTRGRYGSRAATVTTARARTQARLLSAGEDDEAREARARCTREMSELRDQLQANEQAMRRLAQRDRKARDAHRGLEAREDELRRARDARLDALRAWERQKIHVDSKMAQLESLVGEERRDAQASGAGGNGNGVSLERRRITQLLRDNASRRADLLDSVRQEVEQTAAVLHEAAAAGLRGLSDARALNALRAEAERQRRSVDEARAAYEAAADAFVRAKQAAKECLDETRLVTQDMSDAERQAVREAQELRGAHVTCEELEIELSTCRQRLSMAASSGLSARVVAEHARRKAELAANRAERESIGARVRAVRRQKRLLRERWEAPLAQIVARIGANFARMFEHIGCLGEVQVKRVGDGVVSHSAAAAASGEEAAEAEADEGQAQALGAPRDDEDYGAWGVEIRVAFRRNEALQALDNHRQSGGERAVSTIVYLQALQGLVSAPFRVVDEINQGMDPRNERLVHALIVDTACRPDVAQYFLITPKLLPGLEYHPRMKVLCIFNGEWQPESFNPAAYIAHQRISSSQAAA
ncbi:Structural maintenance of chromosomes protein 5 [Coemansia erecta]|uniref:Structural maintenance of chromosomes protein 5 n=1 Tax=Coemansia erecta TaxID=147472 RepID=A0A9W7Y0U8_9FUNG|nr:Structural maintenance of chromosomes protein 5 [Coemansia erecta]